MKPTSQAEELLRSFYRELYRAWGPQHWWPADSRFEVIVGAYLTQNTAWTNVELALKRLRSARLLSLRGIRKVALPKLEELIRPAGYFHQKAQRLKTFVAFLDTRYAGSLTRMFAQPTHELRPQLLGLNGVGPETADSILLYAGNHPVFVVDAYTRRILSRHEVLPENAPYANISQLFEHAVACMTKETAVHHPGKAFESHATHAPSRMSRAPRSDTAQVFSEMHGLIVRIGKYYCLKQRPCCEQCPLRQFLPQSLELATQSSHP